MRSVNAESNLCRRAARAPEVVPVLSASVPATGEIANASESETETAIESAERVIEIGRGKGIEGGKHWKGKILDGG